jgi:AcrR family transcriptional regulator
MPRRYTLGQRAETKAETRDRIVAAAATVYRDRGMAAASNLAVARAADVAPATVRNHFPHPADLAQAVFQVALAEVRPPGAEIFDGIEGTPARLRRLALELAAFYDRSEPWWRAWAREPELAAAWTSGTDRYERDADALVRTALGPLGTDEKAVSVVATIIGPPTYFALRQRGLGSTEAFDLGLELVIPWLAARAGSG